MGCAVVFGGTGFIGSQFASQLLESTVEKVYLYDSEDITKKPSRFRKKMLGDPRIVFVEGDVRKPIDWIPAESVTLTANFAAVHREPGHEHFEYYETNLLGAENVCAWVEKVNCPKVFFTSSISPYRPGEMEKSEKDIPAPATAYGGSKLAAEKIHQVWQAKDQAKRHLVIVRPGVVFGPGEGGNVSRLIKAVVHRYFFYMGNQGTRKAGTYVKELCTAMLWVMQLQERNGQGVSLFNMCMNPGPSIQEYVTTVCSVAGIQRTIPAIPYRLLLGVAYTIEAIARPLNIKHPFSPVRVRKLISSNNISPGFLVENGYPYQYTLETAFADWKKACPEEWA